MQSIRIVLGQRVRTLRKQMGWSQERLGELSDLHATYVGAIERGERNVSLENLDRLASAFRLSLTELFDFSSHKERGLEEGVDFKILSIVRGLDVETSIFVLGFLEMFEDWTVKQRH